MTDTTTAVRDALATYQEAKTTGADSTTVALCGLAVAELAPAVLAEVDRLTTAHLEAATDATKMRRAYDSEWDKNYNLRSEVARLRADNQRLRDGIEQVAVELDRSADTADQADALRALLADDGTGKLWAIHHQGSDEYPAQPSKTGAERMKAWLDGYDAAQHGDPHAALHKAVVVEWPLSAERHAAHLAEAVAR